MIYGYARVSTVDQNLERQLAEFNKMGIPKKCIYSDKKSGKDFYRESYLRLIRKIKKGDLLVIKSIDRLGRNYVMITNEWKRITREIEADILVLDMPLLDTREKKDSLMGKFIADVVLQVLSFVAENERVNIKIRQREGIDLAKKMGVKFGRPHRVLNDDQIKIIKNYNEGDINLSTALNETNMKNSLFFYYLKKFRAEQEEFLIEEEIAN